MVVTHRHVLLALLRADFSREPSSGRLLTQSRLVVQVIAVSLKALG